MFLFGIYVSSGVTGRAELEKAYALNVGGSVSSGRGTVRHQRPSERAAWQRISSAINVLVDMKCDPFATE